MTSYASNENAIAVRLPSSPKVVIKAFEFLISSWPFCALKNIIHFNFCNQPKGKILRAGPAEQSDWKPSPYTLAGLGDKRRCDLEYMLRSISSYHWRKYSQSLAMGLSVLMESRRFPKKQRLEFTTLSTDNIKSVIQAQNIHLSR